LTWIKICGITNPEDAAIAVEAGADALGLIFAPSVRRVTPEVAQRIVSAVPPTMQRVGVFVNEAPERLFEIAGQVGLTTLQLHGDEDASYVRRLRDDANWNRRPLRVFKAVAIAPGWEALLEGFLAEQLIDGLLLDSAADSPAAYRGGRGTSFDWEQAAGVVQALPLRVRLVAGGGLAPANVDRAIAALQPWGVDVCSGVERQPGRKDAEKVRAFVAAVRGAAAANNG
jgi:phosphoribosylanthranilate isomerase